MENGSRLRIALFSLLGIILLVLSIWGIISITRSIFKPKKTTQNTTQAIVVSDYARPDTAAKLQASGPIVADEKFVSYDITITETSRTLTLYNGYQKTTNTVKQYSNNHEAYRTFLSALEQNNFVTRLQNATNDDETAACSSGKRYVYILADQLEDVSRLWSTSCSKTQGTMGGNSVTVRSLFKAQIPDFSTTVTGPFSVLQ